MPVCRIDYLRVAWQTSQERGTTFGLVGEFTGPLFGARRLRSTWKIRSNDLSFARLDCYVYRCELKTSTSIARGNLEPARGGSRTNVTCWPTRGIAGNIKKLGP
jgi:hypothetical protein